MTNLEKNTALIKRTAQELGFFYCGIAKAEKLDEDAKRLENWLRNSMQGGMQYMENHFELRIDPGKLVPGARSVITVLQNYFPKETQSTDSPRIAKYAYGKDYHEVIRKKLKEFLGILRDEIGDIQGRGFVDSAPVLERSWAVKSGAGWIGKNGNLINKGSGSFYFIATLIVDLPLVYDDPIAKDYCGSCRKCMDACPTGAILDAKVINGSQCISYYTIELKEALIPDQLKGKFENWMFGCDTCQDVCPWNRFSKPTTEPDLQPIPGILNLTTAEWENMQEETFRELCKHSPLKRAKYSGIQRNLIFLRNQ